MFFAGFRLVNSWQEVILEMRGDSGRKSPRKLTKMQTGFLKWLERHMQYFQTLIRYVIPFDDCNLEGFICITLDFIFKSCEYFSEYHNSSLQSPATSSTYLKQSTIVRWSQNLSHKLYDRLRFYFDLPFFFLTALAIWYWGGSEKRRKGKQWKQHPK